MHFFHKQKIPQIGQNSFKEFTSDLQNQTKNLSKSFKHTLIDQDIFQKQLQQQDVPNVNYHGTSWDSKHLDLFLQDNNYSSPTAYGTVRSMNKNTSTKTFHSQKGPSQRNHTSQSTRQSFFFTSVPRKQGENRFQISDFKNNYSNKNFLVIDQSVNQQTAQQYYQTRFTVPEKPFELQKLEMSKQPLNYQKPSSRLEELKNVKSNQKMYQQWKSIFNEKSKSYRYHKQAFTSGIICLDNPGNVNSKLYEQEAKYLDKLKKDHETIVDRHKKQVEKYNETAQEIEFCNPKTKQQQPATQQNHIKICPYWNQKQQVQDGFMQQYKNSQDRLFGAYVNNYSLQRADYIRKCETRERNYDIIGNFDNKIDIKQDQGVQKSN